MLKLLPTIKAVHANIPLVLTIRDSLCSPVKECILLQDNELLPGDKLVNDGVLTGIETKLSKQLKSGVVSIHRFFIDKEHVSASTVGVLIIDPKAHLESTLNRFEHAAPDKTYADVMTYEEFMYSTGLKDTVDDVRIYTMICAYRLFAKEMLRSNHCNQPVLNNRRSFMKLIAPKQQRRTSRAITAS
jgi:hypothetical protein